MRTLRFAAALFALVLAPRSQEFPTATIDCFGAITVQDQGRLKPLSTVAHWTLTRFRGRASCITPDGRTLTPTAWLLDLLFFPERAKDYEVFLVENDAVLAAIGVTVEGKQKRDRYSFAMLQPGLERAADLAERYQRLEARQRTGVENQILQLAVNLLDYMELQNWFEFAQPAAQGNDPHARHGGRTLAIFAPPNPRMPEWLTPAEIDLVPAAAGLETLRKTRELLAELPALRNEPAGFAAKLDAVKRALDGLAQARLQQAGAKDLPSERRELGLVGFERTYYRLDLVYRSLYVFVFGFLACAAMWFLPRSKKLLWTAFAAVGAGEALLVTAIVLRCILRGRPPVVTLYETILFITAVGVLVALFMEIVQRKGLATSVASVLGVLGMFLANRYEISDGQDTMPTVQAVLDTNFWLATHVTSITIGYSAGLLAAALAHVYLLGKFFAVRTADPAFYRNVSRMVYGVTCFGLFFSVVGTILGGVWANDSWGRFWGWDPKENGALLICLAQITMLHARMGGYLREHGMCMAAIVTGMIVAASWWGVNLLQVGLHSYGFTSGIAGRLMIFWGTQGLVLLLGAAAWFAARRLTPRSEATSSGASGESVPAK